MGFLSPIWLFAIAAISIPVVIHLWNVRSGKTLKVGSIALIETSSRKRSRSLKLLDILLLLLRCLLLVLLALVLALPYFKSGRGNGNIKGWLLVPKENIKEVYQKFKPKIDSLRKMGFEFHYFNSGFQSVKIDQALADTPFHKSEISTPYWDLLRQLAREVPGKLPVYVITPNLLNKFNGERPEMPLNLDWITYNRPDSSAYWVQKAWFTEDKNVFALIGTSKPSGTYYNTVNISSSDQKNSPYIIAVNNGRAAIRLKNNGQEPVAIDTAAIKVDIFEGNNPLDASYVKAALQTVAQFTKYPLIVKPFNNPGTAHEKKDWLFWLYDKPVDKKLLSNYRQIFAYENGKITSINSWLCFDNPNSVTQVQNAIYLYKTIRFNASENEPLWHDGFGNTVLSKDQHTDLYHFYSRFNPAWTDLVWNNAFPKIILQLLLRDDFNSDKNKYDRRVIDKTQLLPVKTSGELAGTSSYKLSTDIYRFFWLIMVLLFLTERWLAHKSKFAS